MIIYVLETFDCGIVNAEDRTLAETRTNVVPKDQDADSSRTVIVRISPAAHRALRIKVAEQDTSIQAWLEQLIERELGLRPPPSGRK